MFIMMVNETFIMTINIKGDAILCYTGIEQGQNYASFMKKIKMTDHTHIDIHIYIYTSS